MSLIRASGGLVHDAEGTEASREEPTTPEQPAIEARLSDVARRIDVIASRLTDVREDTRIRVERRVRIVRAIELDVRSSLERSRSSTDGSRGGGGSIGRSIDEMEIQIDIASAQMELDGAGERMTFESIVRQQLAAYRAYADLLDGQARAGRPSEDPDTAAIRSSAARAEEQLRRYRDLSDEVSSSLRAGVLAALDDVDVAVRASTTTDGHRTEGGSDR